jgi:hypothetical protein
MDILSKEKMLIKDAAEEKLPEIHGSYDQDSRSGVGSETSQKKSCRHYVEFLKACP